MNMLRRLWDEEQGAVVSIEILVIATILVIALMAAWVTVRNAVIIQINDQAEWISGQEIDDLELVPIGDPDDDVVTCSDLFGPGA
jgi:Flp pilus assembly pilin Flp